MLQAKPEFGAIKRFGDQLTKVEYEISSFDKNTSISFLIELLTVMRENIEQADLLELATQTIGVYSDIGSFTDLLITRAQKIEGLLDNNETS